MEKPKQIDLFDEPEQEVHGADGEEGVVVEPADEKAALWEAEKEEFGTMTDEEKKEKKKNLQAFIKAEKRRIFGKSDDELL